MNPSFICTRSIAAFVACSIFAVASETASAQTTAFTDPVGYITLNVAGTGGTGSSKLSFAGLGLTRPVEYQGSAESVGANTLTDNEATWTNDQFNGSAGAYYVEIASGAGAGTTYDVTATNAATKTITLAQNLSGAVAGVSFKVRKHWTVGSVFGATNEAGIGGGNSTTADQILIWDPTTSGYKIYFYQTSGLGGTGWRRLGVAGDAGGAIIYPDDAVIVRRLQNSNVGVVLLGAVKTGPTSVPVSSGVNFVGNVYAAPLTLADSGIYTGNATTGLAGGNSTTADQILIWNTATNGYDIYFYQTSGLGGTGWRKLGVAGDASATPIPVGTSVIVKRNASAGFDWVIPQHPTNL